MDGPIAMKLTSVIIHIYEEQYTLFCRFAYV